MGIECPLIFFRRTIGAFWASEHAKEGTERGRQRTAWGDSPRRPNLRAVIIVGIRPLGLCSKAPVAVAARASTPRSGRQTGFARLEYRCQVMMCPEPAGRPWVARCNRPPP